MKNAKKRKPPHWERLEFFKYDGYPYLCFVVNDGAGEESFAEISWDKALHVWTVDCYNDIEDDFNCETKCFDKCFDHRYQAKNWVEVEYEKFKKKERK